MDQTGRHTKIAGILIIAGMIAGFLSVAPAVDSPAYISGAAENTPQVLRAAVFQFIMAIAYLSFALALFPLIRKKYQGLAFGFLSFRIVASVLVIIGTLVLVSILALSQQYHKLLPQDPSSFEALGDLLKTTRDLINHVFMILVLCLANMLFYIHMIKTKFIPMWLSVWGMAGALSAVTASLLVLFGCVEIITSEYIVLNIPTALQELTLAIWLIIKGFNKTRMAL